MAEEKRKGVVTRAHGNRFIVCCDGDNFNCQVLKKVKFLSEKSNPVVVGDDVNLIVTGPDTGAIEFVYKRRRILSRPAVGQEGVEQVLAANIDSLIIVTSTRKPALKPGLIDRFLIVAQMGGLKPAIVINKIDLQYDREIKELATLYRGLGYDLFLTRALNASGFEHGSKTAPNDLKKLHRYLGRHRSILAGHSGAGKSSLLNKFYPGLNLKISDISKASGKGRHTTSHFELFQLPGGGCVIDSPGLKVLGLWQMEKESLAGYFPEMSRLAGSCRFARCSHIHEPECAIKDAVEKGKISSWRYNSYVSIYNSL